MSVKGYGEAAASEFAEDLGLALELANIADEISLAKFRAVDLVVNEKPDRTPVTEADLTVEQAIRDHLALNRPDDSVLGEEFGAVGDSARQWIIDPIDGTANFLRGVPAWGTLVALAVNGEPVVGVASMPALGKRWWAARGAGAWTGDGAEPRRVQVSEVTDLENASLSFQSIAQWRDAGYLDALHALTKRVWRDRAYGDLWPYMLLAEGQVDVVAEFDLKVHDFAAIIPIVEEAGGRFTSVTGASVTGTTGISDGSALATNDRLHAEVLTILTAAR